MAHDDEPQYVEGVDFKWVPMKDSSGDIIRDGKGGAVKTRHFFTRSERAAMATQKSSPKNSKAPVRVAEPAVSTNALKGYDKGDVVVTNLPAKEPPVSTSPLDGYRKGDVQVVTLPGIGHNAYKEHPSANPVGLAASAYKEHPSADPVNRAVNAYKEHPSANPTNLAINDAVNSYKEHPSAEYVPILPRSNAYEFWRSSLNPSNNQVSADASSQLLLDINSLLKGFRLN